jgi:hypothetical protein
MKAQRYSEKVQAIRKKLIEEIKALTRKYGNIPLGSSLYPFWLELYKGDSTAYSYEISFITSDLQLVEKENRAYYDFTDINSVDEIVNLYEKMEENVQAVNNLLKEYGTRIRKTDDLPYTELMMDNHKVITWCNQDWYVPEDASYSDDEADLYDVLIESNLKIFEDGND